MDDGSLALRRLCTVPKTSVHLLSRKESEGRKRKGEGRCRRRRRARTVISFPCTAKVPLFRQIKSLCYTRSDEGTKVDDSLSLSLFRSVTKRVHTPEMNRPRIIPSKERKKERRRTSSGFFTDKQNLETFPSSLVRGKRTVTEVRGGLEK